MRKVREIQNGAIYHVTAKTNRGEFILESDEVKDLFLSVLALAGEKYDFELKHFCIMSNHVHLLIKPGKETSLSRLMQYVLSVFAVRFNRIFGLTGHVWYDRFKSKIIRSFIQFINTFHYISNNPVKAGICLNAENYFYCGLYEIKKKCFRFLTHPDKWMKLVL